LSRINRPCWSVWRAAPAGWRRARRRGGIEVPLRFPGIGIGIGIGLYGFLGVQIGLGRRRTIAAEGCGLDQLLSAHDMDQPEPAADDPGSPEQRRSLFRGRIGGDIEILGRAAEQQVAHRTADHERLVAMVLQCRGDPKRTGADAFPADAVPLARDHLGIPGS